MPIYSSWSILYLKKLNLILLQIHKVDSYSSKDYWCSLHTYEKAKSYWTHLKNKAWKPLHEKFHPSIKETFYKLYFPCWSIPFSISLPMKPCLHYTIHTYLQVFHFTWGIGKLYCKRNFFIFGVIIMEKYKMLFCLTRQHTSENRDAIFSKWKRIKSCIDALL